MSGWNSWFDPLQASSVQADESESEHEPVLENHSGHDGGYTKEDELETYENPAYAGSSALIGVMNVKRMQSSVGNSGVSQWMKNSGVDVQAADILKVEDSGNQDVKNDASFRSRENLEALLNGRSIDDHTPRNGIGPSTPLAGSQSNPGRLFHDLHGNRLSVDKLGGLKERENRHPEKMGVERRAQKRAHERVKESAEERDGSALVGKQQPLNRADRSHQSQAFSLVADSQVDTTSALVSSCDIHQQHLPISDSSTVEPSSLDGWAAIHSLLFSLRYSRTTDLAEPVWLNAIRAFEKLQPASQTQALEQLLAELRALEVAQQHRILTSVIGFSPTDKNSLLIGSLIRSMLSQFKQPDATSPDATGDEQ